jgi:hypothetical protein
MDGRHFRKFILVRGHVPLQMLTFRRAMVNAARDWPRFSDERLAQLRRNIQEVTHELEEAARATGRPSVVGKLSTFRAQ